MRNVIWLLVIVLVVLHQDVWFWNDSRLIFGFLPITLCYHMCLSMAAGVTWYFATKFAWPSELADDQTGE